MVERRRAGAEGRDDAVPCHQPCAGAVLIRPARYARAAIGRLALLRALEDLA